MSHTAGEVSLKWGSFRAAQAEQPALPGRRLFSLSTPCQIHLPWLTKSWVWLCLGDELPRSIPLIPHFWGKWCHRGQLPSLPLLAEPPSLHPAPQSREGAFILPSCAPAHRETVLRLKHYSYPKASSSPAQSNVPKSSRQVVPAEPGSVVPCTTAPAIYHKKLSVKLIQDVSWCTII